MGKSLKINYLFNLANTISGLLFPLITFPYASRILLADGIGQINFFQSIIQYITLLTCLGIPMYAVREVARVRDNVEERNIISIEIFLLHAILSIIGYVIVAILTVTISEIRVDIPLFLLLSSTIFFTAIGCEWFYQGVEDFKYITIRGLIVKTISVFLLFLFVKTKEDILWYGAYSVFGILGGNIFNFFRLRKYIYWKELPYRKLNPFRHFKPALRIFVLNLIISIYIQLSTIMLGFMVDTTSVGLYTAAYKLINLILGIISALGVVMLPKVSFLIANGQKDEFKHVCHKAMQFVIAITLPMTIGIILVSPYLIPLFCGETYTPAIPTLQIMAPIILAIGTANILGYQVLYPQGQEKKIIISSAIGAIINFTLNLWLIPLYKYNGASISIVIAESVVTTCMILLGGKYIPFTWKIQNYSHYIWGTLWMVLGVWGWKILNICSSNILNLLISCTIGMSIYTLFLVVANDAFFLEIKSILSKRIRDNHS